MSERAPKRFVSRFPTEDGKWQPYGPLDSITEDVSFTGFRTAEWIHGKFAFPEEVRPIHTNVLEALESAALKSPDKGVTLLGEREKHPPVHKSYAELYEGALRIANGLKALGVDRKDRVILVLPTGHEFIMSFFAIQAVGAVPIPVYPPAGMQVEAGIERLGRIARQSRAKVCITWDAVMPVLGDLGLSAPTLEYVTAVPALLAYGPIERIRVPRPDKPAFIQYTSGSTGDPKGVVLTHDNLVCNVHSIGQAIEVRRDDRVASWCPLYHDMGLIGALLFAIYWRLPMVLMSPLAFLRRPHRWLRAISDYRCTLSPAPNFGYILAVRRVTEKQREGLDLSCWRWAGNGAEQVNVDTVQNFTDTYAPYGLPAHAVCPIYGLAEASVAVTFSELSAPIKTKLVDREALANGYVEPSDGGPQAIAVACVGKAIPGQVVQVVDSEGQQCSEDVVGHVLAGGRSIMQGYFENQSATDEVVRDGFLWTGDLGFVSGGELYITGRVKDLIIVRGKNYYAEDLESAAEALDGVRGGGCVAFGVYDESTATDKVVVICETKLTDKAEKAELLEQVREHVSRECGLTIDVVEIVVPGTIPKTSSGKRRRGTTRTRWVAGELKPPSEATARLAWMFMRSQFGYAVMRGRKLFGRS